MLVAQLRLTLCNPLTEGSTVNGIFRARIQEWVTMHSSMDRTHLIEPRDWTHISYVSCIGRPVLYHLAPPVKPWHTEVTTNRFPFSFLQITAISPLEDRIVRTWPHHSENSFAMELISDETTNSLINLPTDWRVCVQTRKCRAPTAGSIPSTNMAESWNLKLS